MLRVLMLIDRLEAGGAETHVVTLARELQRKGAQLTVLSCGGALESELVACGVRVAHFPCAINGAVGLLRALGCLRKLQRRERFDVLHAHTRKTALLLRLQSFLGMRTGGNVPHCYRPAGWYRVSRPLLVVTAHARFFPRYRHLSYWGERTVAVSEDIRAHLRTYFDVKDDAVRVIVNGIDLARFCPEERDREERFFEVVFASRLDGDCSAAAHLLLDIAPTLARLCRERGRELRVTLLGGGDELPTLRDRAAGMAERIEFGGYVTHPETYFKRADVFVGVSRAALEALSCGCNVILAGNEGFGGLLTKERFAKHAAANFCCRGMEKMSAEGMIAAFSTLLDRTPSEAAREKRAIGALLRRDYSATRMGEQTMRLYAAALSQHRQLRVAVAGYFGRGNLGDDAIARCLLRLFDGATAPASLVAARMPVTSRCRTVLCTRAVGVRWGAQYTARRRITLPDGATVAAVGSRGAGDIPVRLRVILLSAAHTGEDRLFGAKCVPRGRLLALVRTVRHADALLLGGGTLLQNGTRHGMRSLLYYLGLLLLAKLCGCPYSLRANGLGPIDGAVSRALVRLALQGAADISLRDVRSVKIARACGYRGIVLHCPDPVIGMRAESKRRTAFRLRRAGVPEGRAYVCVAPREMTRETEAHLLALLQKTRESDDLPTVLLLPMDRERDITACERLRERIGEGAAEMVCPHEMAAAGVLRGACAVISMRLHGLLLCLNGQRTPRLYPIAQRATEDKLSAFVPNEK